jgi:hypothetical protein
MEAIIDHLEGDYAILKLPDGQEIKLPINELPVGYQEGRSIWLKLEVFSSSLEKDQGKSWKNLLNEILKEDSSVSK